MTKKLQGCNSRIIAAVREELSRSGDDATRRSFQRFFKEETKHYGVKVPVTLKIGKQYYRGIKDVDKREIFALCEELLRSGYCEEAFIAGEWAYSRQEKFEPADFKRLEYWVEHYVSNWAVCDTLCNHTIGAFMERYPGYIGKLKGWARSPNRWVRRAAAVTLIIPAKHGKFLTEVFEIADLLLTDKEDLVQKGYGWLLKEASRLHHKEVFAYLMRHKNVMPRTAFRYALEKMPGSLRSRAMAK